MKINIATAARKLKAQGKTLKPLETKLVNGKFVAYYEVNGKRMTAQEVKGLLKMSLARARQLSMKKRLSLASDDTAARQTALAEVNSALSSLKKALSACNEINNPAGKLAYREISDAISMATASLRSIKKGAVGLSLAGALDPMVNSLNKASNTLVQAVNQLRDAAKNSGNGAARSEIDSWANQVLKIRSNIDAGVKDLLDDNFA